MNETMRKALTGILLAIGIAVVTWPPPVRSDAPQRLPYQGYMTDANQVPINGLVSIHFALYATAEGGDPHVERNFASDCGKRLVQRNPRDFDPSGSAL